MPTARPLLPWVVWGVAALAYSVAVINRSSLAALGPATQDHFGIDATTLASFAVIQLIVYAALQIPVGIFLDRIGATNMILIGGVLMVVGQTLMAIVPDVGLAILARVFVGAGDACTFISVMRLLPEWFAVRQLPVVSQLTGLLGQTGQLVAVTPLAASVAVFGWTAGFLGVAAVGLLLVVLCILVLRNEPGLGTVFERWTGKLGRTSLDARSLAGDTLTSSLMVSPPATTMIAAVGNVDHPSIGRGLWRKTQGLLKLPGVRLAYWLHFTSPFSATVFLLLWGTPFLTGGAGLSGPAAKGLLSLAIVSSMVAGLVLGPLSSRFVERRVWLNLGITVMTATVWIAVLLWPGQPPIWLLVTLVVVMPFGGPASMISFEVARSHTPRSYAGLSTGLVNTAGFTSALLVILLIGLVLDFQGAGSPESYSLTAFRWAFAVQIPFWVLGLVMICVEFVRTGRWMTAHGRKLR